jgi:tetratricopeptide (TPR) repeat protein
VYAGTGSLEQAAGALREAEELLAGDPRTSANQHAVLDLHQARLALAHGDPASAVAHAERGLTRPPGNDEQFELLLVLAEAFNERGDFAQALATVERARPAIDRFVGDLPHSAYTGRCRLERGIALIGQGEVDAGRKDLRTAVEQLEASVGPGAAFTKRAKARLQGMASVSVARP